MYNEYQNYKKITTMRPEKMEDEISYKELYFYNFY